MSERTSGLYRSVTVPAFYRAFQNVLGGVSAREKVRARFFPELTGKHVLEVGCGPGTWYPHLSECASYTGIDRNAAHIRTASDRYASKTTQFVCGDVMTDLKSGNTRYDRIFTFGLLHHLDDGQAAKLVHCMGELLADGGEAIMIEPAYHENQHPVARWLCNLDSGQNVRRPEGYEGLLTVGFERVHTHLFTDLLRIPYSHCILVVSQPLRRGAST